LDLGQNYEAIRQTHPEKGFRKVFTFNSSRKSMSTVIPLEDGGFRVFTKGASEIVLQKCRWQLGTDGLQTLDEAKISHLVESVVEPMASDGLRTICLAYKDYKQGKTLALVLHNFYLLRSVH
jgi:magnesium-transporting ATPase (P-type)